jgi:small subunit ribosomal protein S11
MGKKHIIKPNEAELLKESEKVETAVQKEAKASKEPLGKFDEGRVYISSSYNNTIITFTDPKGNVVTWTSAGAIGFKGTKKATPFAASKVAETIATNIKKMGVQKIAVFVKGIGSGRESAIRSFAGKGFDILSVTDMTPVPHNGCRPKKTRRV